MAANFQPQFKESHLSVSHLFPRLFSLHLHSPELLVADVVSDDGPVAHLLVGLIPHDVQLCRGQCTDPDVFWTSLRPLSVCYELQKDKTLRRLAPALTALSGTQTEKLFSLF